MNALRLILEEFEGNGVVLGADGDVRSQQATAEAYREGYAAGIAAAEEKQQHDHTFFDQAAAQLNDVITGLPTHLNQQIGEAIVAVLQKVLPALAADGFAQETATAILKHADLSDPGSVVIKVSEERAEQLKDAFVKRSIEEIVTIEVDAALSDSTVTAYWKNGGLEMDIDLAVRASLECLNDFALPSKEEKTDE